MERTTNLNLPYIMAAQAQKHVTHNEAIRALDAIVQASVIDRDLSSPPVSPSEGDSYIVASSASAEWATHENEIAAWQDDVWMFYPAQEGWLVWAADEDQLLVWDGSSWAVTGGGGGGGSTNLNPATGGLVGVNATADTTNRLSVSSPASLFNHEGAGHQQKINKNTVSDTASQLYQTGFSGRAEIGLTGDDDFHFKVSPDGSTFYDSLIIDKDNGYVKKPLQPYFSGKPLNDYQAGGAPTEVMPMQATFNNGNHWNTSLHRFTCPVSGYYLVMWGGLQLDPLVTSLRKNGARHKNGNHFLGGTVSHITMTQQVILEANANDYFEFESWNGGGYYRDWWEASILLLG